jgi:branched-chain amino acid transport system substrate-binding protein
MLQTLPRFEASQLLCRLVAALLCVALLAGCAVNSPNAQTGSLAPEAKPESQRQSVKVALLVPLSAQGQTGLIGKNLKQAAELALFERDNPNLQLIIKDDKGTPEGAVAAAEDALKNGATLILGPLFAKSVSAAAPVARKAGVPVVAFSNDRQVAGNGVYLLSFQPGPEVERIVSFAARQGKRRYAALLPQDTLGKAVEPVFQNAASRSGGTIVAMETYPASANGILEPLRKLGAAITAAEAEGAPIDALFIPGGQENLELLGRLLPQAQINTQQVKLIGTGGLDYPNAGRDAALVGAWYPGPDPRGWTDFAQRYAKSYGHAPPRIATLAYDGMNLAIALAGSSEAQPYSAAMITRQGGFAGVDGAYRLLPDGTAERSLAILEVQRFAPNVIEPAPALPNAAGSPTAVSSSGLNFFNFAAQ